jgi:hypothetical protein
VREEFGDIWEMAKRPNSVVCITTNGYVNARRECTMGRGVALQAKKRYPGIAKELGDKICRMGNHCHSLCDGMVLSFPTKHVWWRPSLLELIRQSAEELHHFASTFGVPLPSGPNAKYIIGPLTFYLPRPGCQNGGLLWKDVKPVLESVGLPDNVVVVTNDTEQWEAAQYDSIYEEVSGGN